MSPLARLVLARSLLALAALLASANCDTDNCVRKDIGEKTSSPIVLPSVHASEPGKELVLENACSPGAVIGEMVIACSHIDGYKPTINMTAGSYTPVDVSCPYSGGCEVDITQYC